MRQNGELEEEDGAADAGGSQDGNNNTGAKQNGNARSEKKNKKSKTPTKDLYASSISEDSDSA